MRVPVNAYRFVREDAASGLLAPPAPRKNVALLHAIDKGPLAQLHPPRLHDPRDQVLHDRRLHLAEQRRRLRGPASDAFDDIVALQEAQHLAPLLVRPADQLERHFVPSFRPVSHAMGASFGPPGRQTAARSRIGRPGG